MTWCGQRFDASAMLLHDLLHGRQAQARSKVFRREQRFEYLARCSDGIPGPLSATAISTPRPVTRLETVMRGPSADPRPASPPLPARASAAFASRLTRTRFRRSGSKKTMSSPRPRRHSISTVWGSLSASTSTSRAIQSSSAMFRGSMPGSLSPVLPSNGKDDARTTSGGRCKFASESDWRLARRYNSLVAARSCLGVIQLMACLFQFPAERREPLAHRCMIPVNCTCTGTFGHRSPQTGDRRCRNSNGKRHQRAKRSARPRQGGGHAPRGRRLVDGNRNDAPQFSKVVPQRNIGLREEFRVGRLV